MMTIIGYVASARKPDWVDNGKINIGAGVSIADVRCDSACGIFATNLGVWRGATFQKLALPGHECDLSRDGLVFLTHTVNAAGKTYRLMRYEWSGSSYRLIADQTFPYVGLSAATGQRRWRGTADLSLLPVPCLDGRAGVSLYAWSGSAYVKVSDAIIADTLAYKRVAAQLSRDGKVLVAAYQDSAAADAGTALHILRWAVGPDGTLTPEKGFSSSGAYADAGWVWGGVQLSADGSLLMLGQSYSSPSGSVTRWVWRDAAQGYVALAPALLPTAYPSSYQRRFGSTVCVTPSGEHAYVADPAAKPGVLLVFSGADSAAPLLHKDPVAVYSYRYNGSYAASVVSYGKCMDIADDGLSFVVGEANELLPRVMAL